MTAAAARAFIGLGSNLGQAKETINQALAALAHLPGTRMVAHSMLYRTPPWGRVDQPDFINAVAQLQTQLAPLMLLEHLLALERRFGRVRNDTERWGPRQLDLDLLAYDEKILDDPGLHLPHPHLHERAFVLVPLAEIAPGLFIPGRGRVSELLAGLDTSGVHALP